MRHESDFDSPTRAFLRHTPVPASGPGVGLASPPASPSSRGLVRGVRGQPSSGVADAAAAAAAAAGKQIKNKRGGKEAASVSRVFLFPATQAIRIRQAYPKGVSSALKGALR